MTVRPEVSRPHAGSHGGADSQPRHYAILEVCTLLGFRKNPCRDGGAHAVRRRLGRRAAALPLAVVSAAAAQQTELVSVNSEGEQGDRTSLSGSVSWDGRLAVFWSSARNLVPDDLNNASDIFVRDRRTGETTRVSVSSEGVEASLDSRYPSISGDGRYVAFQSDAPNLVPDDNNGFRDIFVHDRVTGETTRVSVSAEGDEADDHSTRPSISFGGLFIAFESDARNLVHGDNRGGIFVHHRLAETTIRVDGGAYPSISGSGHLVAFESPSTNLVPEDPFQDADIYVRNWSTGDLFFASPGPPTGNGFDSVEPSISADGRRVAYVSEVANLVEDDNNGTYDGFVFDLDTQEVTRVSVSSEGVEGNDRTISADVSPDGRFVTFASEADNLVEGRTSSSTQIYVHDLARELTVRVSVNAVDDPGFGGDSFRSAISWRGRVVVFDSAAHNLVPDDENEERDVFAREWLDPADFDADGDIDFEDLLLLLAAWGPCPGCPEDLDQDDVVGFADLLILLTSWS